MVLTVLFSGSDYLSNSIHPALQPSHAIDCAKANKNNTDTDDNTQDEKVDKGHCRFFKARCRLI